MYHVVSGLNDSLLGIYTTQHNEFILLFQRNVLPPSSRVTELSPSGASIWTSEKLQ
jgi:hypothetical protein